MAKIDLSSISDVDGASHARVPRGSYTDYLNSGQQKMVDILNQLRDDVLVIGSDLVIEIQDGKNKTALTIDRETNPQFVKSFISHFQGLQFSQDSGRPGCFYPTGPSYQPGRFDVYLTKNYYEDNRKMYDTFCKTFNELVQDQYVNVASDTYSHYTRNNPSDQHFGNMLAISTPVRSIKLKYGDSTLVRYRNVKFFSPADQSGNFVTNETIVLQFSFNYSYISFDDENNNFIK